MIHELPKTGMMSINHRFGAAARMAWTLLMVAGCGAGGGNPLPIESSDPLPSDDYRLIARFAHVCDPQIIDEESPARLPFALDFIPAAWRPQESYSTQLLDGIIRAINRHHEQDGRVDFVVFGGDITDNAQSNELNWFLDVLDGKRIDPTSGPDNRLPARKPPPLLDPHAPFQARGLYRAGIHGPLPSIPWYGVVGNHDRFALGIFPIIENLLNQVLAPLPLPGRLGLALPGLLDPLSEFSYALITPGRPGPPVPSFPVRIVPNPQRRFYVTHDYVAAHFATLTGPPGHGLDERYPERTWFSASPVAGLRIVALDSCTPLLPVPAGFYSEGAISPEQIAFLREELIAACSADELVVVVTHHPSETLQWIYGSAATPESFRSLLNRHPCVVAHLVGHSHRHAVTDQGGYLEIETASTLDAPQEGRFIEVWRSADQVELRYRAFSHLDPRGPAVDPDGDPLFELRREALDLAISDDRLGGD